MKTPLLIITLAAALLSCANPAARTAATIATARILQNSSPEKRPQRAQDLRDAAAILAALTGKQPVPISAK